MLSIETLQKFTDKQQTSIENIAREYIQHLFLRGLYSRSGAKKLLFKGGTALKIVYNSPRFSEDLDFTGENIYGVREIEDWFIEALKEIEKRGIDIELKEAKSTSGGYLGIISYGLYEVSEDINFEISLRAGKPKEHQVTTIANDYIPSYVLICLSGEEIVKGKIAALLDRRKARDFYDFYYILRHPELHNYVDKEAFIEVKKLLEETRIDFRTELGVLLPASHHLVLRDFRGLLTKEIEKRGL